MTIEYFIGIVARFLLNFEFAYYLITLLQWYNYSLYRIIFMHHKFMWHIWFFLLPLSLATALQIQGYTEYVMLIAIALLIALGIWRFKQDKPLKFTKRVQRFFALCLLFVLLDEGLGILFETSNPFMNLLPLVFALVVSNLYERVLLKQYRQIAKDKLEVMSRLKIIAITASFGKTSIKNFLQQILSTHFSVYATPRSVNTLTGIIADVNENLDYSADIYLAEAGARLKGDIDEITQFLQPQYTIIGEVGAQHLEYFKTLENITNTKFEILNSSRLRKAFVFEQNTLPKDLDSQKKKLISFYPTGCRNVKATLEGTSFELEYKGNWYPFHTQILGAFNVGNIAAAVSMALELGMRMSDIQHSVSKFEPVPHRLQKILTNQKLILDDSFNGNLKGMLEAARLASLYEGRKVVVTPGIVESNQESNIELARYFDEVFDIVIITGTLNAKIFSKHIVKAQKIILHSKESLEGMLKACTLPGDLILFSNDAPNFI
ncbi:UDP-MurNac-pentapeptide presynthetase MurF [Helicobacter sp. TUL]|uniref:Mur ligase family protein n=1 Tax=Helicobacter sp. TUL TaxID=1848928 RepID=UPI000BAB96F2|nr:UDP-N-acetylmuramoyl-tripeptide--D-alanyl-D-alanine ligase [Helicobacter sp. TUL]PAV00028.1 UDP-MurNac-pentapeptide presynthetase MurF [Helicobacter sp. TUL]